MPRVTRKAPVCFSPPQTRGEKTLLVVFFLPEDVHLQGEKKKIAFSIVTLGLFGIKRQVRKAESSSGTATNEQGRQEQEGGLGVGLCLLSWEKKLNRGMAKFLLLETSE